MLSAAAASAARNVERRVARHMWGRRSSARETSESGARGRGAGSRRGHDGAEAREGRGEPAPRGSERAGAERTRRAEGRPEAATTSGERGGEAEERAGGRAASARVGEARRTRCTRRQGPCPRAARRARAAGGVINARGEEWAGGSEVAAAADTGGEGAAGVAPAGRAGGDGASGSGGRGGVAGGRRAGWAWSGWGCSGRRGRCERAGRARAEALDGGKASRPTEKNAEASASRAADRVRRCACTTCPRTS